jgi:hypothetical protein
MKYEIIRLDGRFAHRDLFGYAIKFSNRMAIDHGPLKFNDVLKWFSDTYGWSAEIRDYVKMQQWTTQNTQWMGSKNFRFHVARGILEETPVHCNPHWSWTNGYDDLRIYVKSDAEIAFFQLKFPVDQK